MISLVLVMEEEEVVTVASNGGGGSGDSSDDDDSNNYEGASGDDDNHDNNSSNNNADRERKRIRNKREKEDSNCAMKDLRKLAESFPNGTLEETIDNDDEKDDDVKESEPLDGGRSSADRAVPRSTI